MKVLVTGAKGQLGHDVMEQLQKRGHHGVGVDIEEMDITNEEAVMRVMGKSHPDAVIHCAAWTAVDLAEDEENLEKVHQINAVGTKHVATACKEISAKMMYISTDYVFDGTGERPWEPDDLRAPLNVYGKTKCDGELAVEEILEDYFIVRIAWVFGVQGKNFVKTMLQLGKTRDRLTVVSDQIGAPTYTADLARLLVDMIETERYGRYHATNEGGYISWYDFAVEIMKQAAELHPAYGKVSVAPVTSDAYPAKAKRPSNSRMNTGKLGQNGFRPLPTWQDALRRYLREIEV